MALDDRDRNLERALARHLRSSSASGALPDSSEGGAAPTSSCPDAETLAAYHDGSLSADEHNAWKAHVLACEDCQIVLQHLATPLDAPLVLDPAASVLAAESMRHSPSSGSTAATPVAVAPLPISSISLPRARRPYFRWLVPAGAIAAGLLAWVVLRESQLPKLTPKIEDRTVQIAENRSTPPPPGVALTTSAEEAMPKSTRVSPAPVAKDRALTGRLDELKKALPKQESEEKSKSTANVGADSVGGIVQQLPSDQQKSRDRLQSALQVPYPAGISHGPRVAQQQQQSRQSLALSGAPANDRKAQPEKDAELAREGEALAAKLPPPSAVAQSDEPSNFIAGGSIAPPPPPAKAAQGANSAPAPSPATPASADKATSSTEAVGAVSETVVVESAAPSTSVMRLASAPIRGPQLFSDPAYKSFWRVGAGGSLEFSINGGATWAPQSSGVTAELFTGSAPAAKVCWIVGAQGTILRTIDAGKHWLKLGAPAVADILGIRATDAFHATIWLVPDPKSTAVQTYKTSDGGLTWSLIPNE
jgi:hypothetical protein